MVHLSDIKTRMGIRYVKRARLICALFIAWAVLSGANNVILAEEKDQPRPPKINEQQSPDSDEQVSIKGYPIRMRRIGTPTDVEWDLNNSFPKSGSLLEMILGCDEIQQQ